MLPKVWYAPNLTNVWQIPSASSSANESQLLLLSRLSLRLRTHIPDSRIGWENKSQLRILSLRRKICGTWFRSSTIPLLHWGCFKSRFPYGGLGVHIFTQIYYDFFHTRVPKNLALITIKCAMRHWLRAGTEVSASDFCYSCQVRGQRVSIDLPDYGRSVCYDWKLWWPVVLSKFVQSPR